MVSVPGAKATAPTGRSAFSASICSGRRVALCRHPLLHTNTPLFPYAHTPAPVPEVVDDEQAGQPPRRQVRRQESGHLSLAGPPHAPREFHLHLVILRLNGSKSSVGVGGTTKICKKKRGKIDANRHKTRKNRRRRLEQQKLVESTPPPYFTTAAVGPACSRALPATPAARPCSPRSRTRGPAGRRGTPGARAGARWRPPPPATRRCRPCHVTKGPTRQGVSG